MFTSSTFPVVVLVLLVSYLFLSLWIRGRTATRAEQARLQAIEREYPPRAFDTSSIAPQIKRVQQDYAVPASRRLRLSNFHAEFLASARRFVTGLAYFRRPPHGRDWQKHDA